MMDISNRMIMEENENTDLGEEDYEELLKYREQQLYRSAKLQILYLQECIKLLLSQN